jgi:Ca2+-dependent lipid-binding protein
MVSSAGIMESDPNDDYSPWDTFGGLPDPFVQCTSDGDLVFNSSVISDTLSPGWFETFEMVITEADGTFECTVFDEDISESDWIGGLQFLNGIPVSVLKDEVYTLYPEDPTYGLVFLDLYITPN